MLSKQFFRLARSRPGVINSARYLNIAVNESSYAHSLPERSLQHDTFGDCLDNAANKWPDRPWLISKYENVYLTFSGFLQQVETLASAFIEIGLQPGDRVGICSPNSSRWLIAMMAAMKAGLITVAINPAYQRKELEFCLKKVGVKAVLAPKSFRTQEYYKMLCDIAPEIPSSNLGEIKSENLPELKSVIMLDNSDLGGAFKYKSLFNLGSEHLLNHMKPQPMNSDSGCLILFTSGTTGHPKAALHSHFGYVNNSWECGARCEFSIKRHKLCFQTPLFHAFGMLITMGALQHGTSVIFPSPAYNVEMSLNAIHSERCTAIIGTPTMYVDLVNRQKALNFTLSTPEIAITGGAPCSIHLFNEIKTHLGAHTMKSVYGMTELSTIFHSIPGEGDYQATETVGQLMGHLEAKIVDKEGTIVPKGVSGELCVRGYSTMLGYWNDAEKTRDILGEDKWLKTGDQFLLEDNGYGKIVGRLKDIIIRGGENIFPTEIEDFLNKHPDVIESYVFGVKDDRMGEEICVAMRLRDEANFGLKQLRQFCEGNIAHFKIPKLIKVLDKFPVTASGKVQKFKLREMVESGQI